MNTSTPTSSTSLVEVSPISLKPIAPIDTIVWAYNEYNKLKETLLNDSDYQLIRGKKTIKKSWFRKLATTFWISTQIVRENRINFEDYFVYEITARAIAPNGRFCEASASCASNEREFNHIENDVRATAQSRATSRSISDLIGWGEVSAEELEHPRNTERKTIESEDTKSLEDSEPHMQWFVHKNNTTYETPDLMTIKQKNYLIKLIEVKYNDEKTRATLYNKIRSFTKREATSAIQKLVTT